MRREYHRWFSGALGRDMEMLTFVAEGEPRGTPVLVFPTSCGRFYEFEERGMVDAVRRQIEEGRVQLFCVDSVDGESWYNGDVPPRWRIARHMQYERYLLEEVLPLMQRWSGGARAITAGCSMGGFHAVNLALRRPEEIFGFLAMSGIFNPQRFLGGYYDEVCTFTPRSPTWSTSRMGGISIAIAGRPMCWPRASTTSAGARTKRWRV